ncbi:hypothetical protein PFISCL1PPCAC_22954 [Pristionchus fissidentatus]|uniref:BTB domain-containing protein n=1 Tax=Pristionchus fissidentatus TaxID=1538716 RepID=A0AAV5WI94_9BILA|nr:hypothetical protein PFISCL1PPCAC_22954 [Pristionchus fissidentatus]
MEEVRRWPLLSLLDNAFIERISSCIVYGSAGCAALILTKDDELYALGTTTCCGAGVSGSTTFEPVLIETMSGRGLKQLSCGTGPHVLALTENGEVYSWGHNSHGQLGLGHTCCSRPPTLVLGPLTGQRVKQVACGAYHSAALTESGELFTWGLNSSGQLGLGSNVNEKSPRQVPFQNRFLKAVACGHKSTMALTESGEVYAWGSNEYGQIGSGNEVNHHSPYLVDTLAKHAVITQIGCNPLRKKLLEPVESAKDIGGISDIAASNACNITVVSNKQGKIFMWGNIRGQTVSTPVETRFSRVDDVFASFASPPVSPRMLTFGEKPQRPLVEALRAAFDDPATADMRVVVDGKTIHVHKALLKMRCAYFRSRLGKQWNEGNGNQIEVSDFSYPIYRAFLQWCYTDELNVEPEQALGLLELANCYCEMELKARCAALVERTTSVDNAAALFAAALRHDCPSLEEHSFHLCETISLSIIQSIIAFSCMMHMTSVTLSDAFSRMDIDAVKCLVTRAAKEGVFKR